MKRKLKKLEQILAENSYIYSNNTQIFYFNGEMPQIHAGMIGYFGKEIDTELDSFNDWSWDESWFEQPVKKKLYAFRAPGGYISFWDNELGPQNGDKRVEEYDIEYGDE